MNKTKQRVKNNEVSAIEAYNQLYPLVVEKYAKHLPTLKWLKNIIDGRMTLNKPRQKQAFIKKSKNLLHKS